MGSRKVLLVEDNPDEEELAKIAFKHCGLKKDEVMVVTDGKEAIDYLFAEGKFANRDPQQPNVIFLDLKLPVMDGLEVLRRIKTSESTAMIPTIILSSSDEPSDILRAYQSGANSYVRKADDFDEFIANIAMMRSYWLELNICSHG